MTDFPEGYTWRPDSNQKWFTLSNNTYAFGTLDEAQQFCGQHGLTYELVDPVTQELLEDGNFSYLILSEELDDMYEHKFFSSCNKTDTYSRLRREL